MDSSDGGNLGQAPALPEIRVPALLTFAGLAAGLALGLLLAGTNAQAGVLAITQPVGSLWLAALKMTILPLVAGLLFTGIVQGVATARAGPLARTALGLFAAILVISAVIGIAFTPLLLGLFPVPPGAGAGFAAATGADTGTLPQAADFLSALMPENVIGAAAKGELLPVIVFISLLAFASTRLGDTHRQALGTFFAALAGAMMVVIGWILALAPLGVFALAFGVAAQSGADAISALVHYIAVVSAVGIAMLAGAYLLAVFAARQSPLGFARALIPAQAVAISTQSSLASLPAMLASCRTLGLRDASGEFTLPLAVALLRATSPAMNLAVVIYIAHLAGIEPTPGAIVVAGAVAVLASLSTVSLPGTVSFIATIAPIAMAMGVPIEPLVILLAVEMLPDIVRTLANVTMDVAVTAVVDRRGLPAQK